MSSQASIGDPVLGGRIFSVTPLALHLTHWGTLEMLGIVFTFQDLSFPICKLELLILNIFRTLLMFTEFTGQGGRCCLTVLHPTIALHPCQSFL